MMENSPKMAVKCGVENCRYNDRHQCQAQHLEVDAMGASNRAEDSDSTCCSTFDKHIGVME